MLFKKNKKAKAEVPAKKEAAPAKKATKPVKKATPAKKTKAETKEKPNYRTYHVVKRDDGKWEVKFAGGEKAIKLFNTQAEAVEYTKAMAKNQDGAMLVHNSKGANKGKIKSK